MPGPFTAPPWICFGLTSDQGRVPADQGGPPQRGQQLGPNMSSVSALEHTAIGALAGVVEVCVMQVRRGTRGPSCRRRSAAAASARSATWACSSLNMPPVLLFITCSQPWASRMRCKRGGPSHARCRRSTADLRWVAHAASCPARQFRQLAAAVPVHFCSFPVLAGCSGLQRRMCSSQLHRPQPLCVHPCATCRCRRAPCCPSQRCSLA